MFSVENPEIGGDDFIQHLNSDSLQTIFSAKLEPSLKKLDKGRPYQFLRNGYFCQDIESSPEKLIFNRTVSLRDGWKTKK